MVAFAGIVVVVLLLGLLLVLQGRPPRVSLPPLCKDREQPAPPRESGYRDNARVPGPFEDRPREYPTVPPLPPEPKRIVSYWSPCPQCGSDKRTMSPYARLGECPPKGIVHAHYTCSACSFRFVVLSPYGAHGEPR